MALTPMLGTVGRDRPRTERLILRDGSAASIRWARPEDREALSHFFKRLSGESFRRVFFSSGLPSPDQLELMCNASNPRVRLTLVVTRTWEGESHVIACGLYQAKSDKVAEVTLAVDEKFHGKGLGTQVLERLAAAAVHHGFKRFWAMVNADNTPMQDIFKNMGLAFEEHRHEGYIDVDLSVVPNEESQAKADQRERASAASSLQPFFEPKSIAVVGASGNPKNLGTQMVATMVRNGFRGPVYPVHRGGGVVCSMRAYSSVTELPEAADLAVVAVPSNHVLEVVDECAARGVKAIVVVTAGFAEMGPEGAERQAQLVERARSYGLRMIGPNCMGILNADPAIRMNATFYPHLSSPGRVAMSSQSGALGMAVLALAARRGVGFSMFASIGNKADVSSNDLLQYWEHHEGTDVILLYLESFGNPDRFSRIARRVSRTKPIVAMKGGRSRSGGRAAGSHTAALAADDTAVEALFLQSGVIRASTLEEMFDVAAGLSGQPLPRGRHVAIVTNAGGPGILCADACEAAGLTVPELGAATQARLMEFLPPSASPHNPVDMIAPATADQFRLAIQTVLADPAVHALIVMYVPVGPSISAEYAAAITEGVAKARADGHDQKPVMTCLIAQDGVAPVMEDIQGRIPVYGFPEAPAAALGKIASYAEWRNAPLDRPVRLTDVHPDGARDLCRQAVAKRGPGWLTVQETLGVLAAYRLPLPMGGVAATAEEAVQLARRIGFPVALKLASHTLIHKTEAGGVRLNLADGEAVRQAFGAIESAAVASQGRGAFDGVLVQSMVKGVAEVMAGVTEDPVFGRLVAFGLGGIHVEVLRDLQFRVNPLTEADAEGMMTGLKGFPLLKGYRGHSPADVPALKEVILRLAQLTEDVPEIVEVDLNPIMALSPGRGCRVVDARIKVKAVP